MQERHTTARGIDAIIRREGSEAKAYRDSAGLLTIGVGHLLTKSELASGKVVIGGEPVKWKDGLTADEIQNLLGQDLREAEEAVVRHAPGLNDNQFDALVSLVFNIGVSAFAGSTLLRRIREGDLGAVPAQILRWNRSGGRVVPGLVRRREDEARQWGL